ncbi:urease subunit beta [Flavobacterium agricola]|uniref:Urease subunit beta n=1 Tax=Flavobacterium agricola TaxID=2870839 RepID=A0ABY6M167_9FLAO|nr:urease subunit beta [Flavobacterium agricola]UYW02302.1 urease subunit beta [Flavobacterium agricola]
MVPGEFFIGEGDIICNEGREVTTITAVNTGDRPIQIGSHFHFFEVNRAMQFDREAAFGKRLNIAASTAVRFEPGEEKTVELVPYAGQRIVLGHNDLVNGETVSDTARAKAMKNITDKHFKNK